MKQCVVFLFLAIYVNFSLFAQQEIIGRATELIVEKKTIEAGQYLDSILRKKPNTVDALMMKGNLLLNGVMDTASSMEFISAADESIFTSGLVPKPKLLAQTSAAKIETLWRKCLLLDSSRTDLRKGLCTVYALSLMKDSLKNEMLRLKKMVGDKEEEAYKMCEYARKFKERNRFEEAMELYAFIARLFPGVAGLRCDIASEYFYEGKMNESLRWLDSTYRFKKVDETSFLNGAFVFSQLGYFDNAQTVLNAYSRLFDRRMDGFYYGLMLFADASPKSAEVLTDFCQTVDSNAYSTEVSLARLLLQHDSSFTFENYRSIVTSPQYPDYYKVLVHTRAVKQFSKNCESSFMYGIYQLLIKNYPAGVQYLEEGEQCRLIPERAEYWKLTYAFALYKMNMPQQAAVYFKQIFDSDKPFYSHAAKYFTAKINLSENKTQEAKKLLEEIISSTSQTKYIQLAKQLL